MKFVSVGGFLPLLHWDDSPGSRWPHVSGYNVFENLARHDPRQGSMTRRFSVETVYKSDSDFVSGRKKSALVVIIHSS